MQPPTESGGDSAPLPEESDSGDAASSAMTADEEVAEWVQKQMKLKEEGLLHVSEKPALHAVALDQVGTGSSTGGLHTPSQNI
jgi:mitogen-activated protein kinase kinase